MPEVSRFFVGASYWLLLFKRSWSDTWRFIWDNVLLGLIVSGVGAVVSFLWQRSIGDPSAILVAVLSGVGTAVALGIGVFLWKLAFLPERIHREQQENIHELERRLADAYEPKLEIIFRTGYPFQDIAERQPSLVSYQLYRVGVKNISVRTVDNVRLVAERMEPDPLHCLPAPLHRMNDNLAPHTPHFRIDPEETVYVDVVYYHEVDPGQPVLWHIVPGVNNKFPFGRYAITLVARGKDIPVATQGFIINTDGDGKLLFNYEAPQAHGTGVLRTQGAS